jgi:16S rRNA G966 N2-methylase RsmD
VEKAATQWRFIDQVARQLNIGNMNLVRGDVFRFISSCKQTFDIIFADPPYTLPNLGDIPALILESKMVKPGTLVVVEHSKAYDFSQLPGFFDRRVYGSVNFSLFRVGMP